MKTDAKVVPLNVPGSEQPSVAVGRLPAVVIQVRDKAALQLKQSLQALFESADDSLFEMADRASSNSEQSAFFEAMRELRLQRKSIERGFLQKLFEQFANLNQYQIGEPVSASLSVSFDSLSLVQDEVLEESVAIDSMVERVLGSDGQALSQLTTRFNSLISRRLEDKTNPLGPRVLCEQFVEACNGLGVEIRVKLIVLKLFERSVLADLAQLYALANQQMIEAGVLPELRSVAPRRQPRANPASRSSADAGATTSLDQDQVQEVFGVLQGLLAEVRGSALLPRRQVPNDAVPITSHDLMRVLSHLQQQLPAQQDVSNFDMRGQLDGVLARASAKSGTARVVGEVDEDVINLVAMLFEFILDDRTLPDSLKALIARLQIPLLKVAVLDKTFFSRGSHPARRLLNEIASAALGWNAQGDAQRDVLYQCIEQAVQRVLNEFTDDPAIFVDVLESFCAFAGDEKRRSELLEQRTRDAEEGRARAEQARLAVEQALNQRLLGKTLPEVVLRLLQEGWSKVLQLCCLKHGAQSPQWQGAVRVMDDLIWSVEPHEEAQDRLRLYEMVPLLLKSLREGLNSAAVDPFITSEYFTQLEALHMQAFQRFKRAEQALQREAAAREEAQLLDVPLLESGVPEALELEVAQESTAMVEVVEEIVLLAPGEREQVVEEVALADDDDALMQVDKLRVGSWVEIQEDDEHRLRCKLAAIIKPTGKYIFVNRTGMKALEKTRMGLALEFRRGAVRMLDDALLFDRALESVIGNLRQLKGA